MIEDTNFTLELAEPWQRVPCDDADQYNLRDNTRDIVATLSSLRLETPAERIEEIATVLVELRLHAEDDAAQAFHNAAVIYEPIIVPRPWGRAVAYYGHDDAGRQFGFAGMVTRHAVITLYMSSGLLNERGLMEAMDEVVSRMEFDRTPLSGASNSN